MAVPIILRELALLGGLVALLLVPVQPQHWKHVPGLLAVFAFYKLGALAIVYGRPRWLQEVRVGTRTLDYLFTFLLVWFTGGPGGQFWLLYMLLVSLDGYESGHRGGLAGATLSTSLLAGDHLLTPGSTDWAHVIAHGGVLFVLGSVLGWLSESERAARAATERLNQELEGALRDLRAAQAKLVQSERLATVGQMTSKVAHEIRNPLGAITLNLGLLEERIPAGGEPTRLLVGVRDQVQVLTNIVEEYLQFGRLARPRPEPTKPATLIAGSVQVVEPELLARGARLVVEVTGPLPLLVADPRLVRQALINLLKNAGEAVGPGGTVRVGAALADEAIEFWVADDGPGVGEADLPRIFEPFYTTKTGGTGLGLAVVQQVALEHGGTVRCESAPGRGARFSLRLPVRAPARREEPARA